jgi:hypothetical protein
MLGFFTFVAKKMAKNWRFLLKTKLNYAKKLIITLVFEKKANFFKENCRKSQKIVIITSTPRIKVEILWDTVLKVCMSASF